MEITNPPNALATGAENDAPIRSIYTKFLRLLIPAVALSAILVLSFYAYIKKNAAEESVIEKINFISASHVDSIKYPLWTLDLPGLERAMKTIAIYPEIFCVEVRDLSEKTTYSHPQNCGADNVETRLHEIPINYQENTVGTLSLYFTDEPAIAQLKRDIIVGAIFFAVLVLVTCIAAFASLRSIVGRPLMQLMKSIRTAKEVEAHEAIDWSSQDEFGEVINAYNGLIVQVNEKTRDLVNARTKAEQATESKGVFLANMSHELRTPLTTVISITEMLREEAEEEQKDTEAFDRVAGSGRHLLGLIDDILQYSKIEAGKVDVSLAKFSLSTLISELSTIAHPLAAQRRNTLKLIFTCQHETILSDELRLRQIILNLLSNACKFTENGQVVLSISDSTYINRAGILFSVKDTGIGISEDNQSKIFEEFSQADISTTRQFGGTGLGLPISQRLCNLLGGHISIVSREGEGTEFSFVLPVNPLAK